MGRAPYLQCRSALSLRANALIGGSFTSAKTRLWTEPDRVYSIKVSEGESTESSMSQSSTQSLSPVLVLFGAFLKVYHLIFSVSCFFPLSGT